MIGWYGRGLLQCRRSFKRSRCPPTDVGLQCGRSVQPRHLELVLDGCPAHAMTANNRCEFEADKRSFLPTPASLAGFYMYWAPSISVTLLRHCCSDFLQARRKQALERVEDSLRVLCRLGTIYVIGDADGLDRQHRRISRSRKHPRNLRTRSVAGQGDLILRLIYCSAPPIEAWRSGL